MGKKGGCVGGILAAKFIGFSFGNDRMAERLSFPGFGFWRGILKLVLHSFMGCSFGGSASSFVTE